MDFLVRSREGSTELVQVCADLTSDATRARELRALAAAGGAYPDALRRVLVITRDEALAVSSRQIEAQPAYEWLLASPEST